MHEHVVDCRGLNIHVVEWGADHERTLLLHHGFLDHARSWDPVAERLARQYRVLAMDARGHGDSAWIGRGGYYFFQDYVLDLDDVIERLAAPPLILVGHSMGGMVCSLYAGTFPGNAAALISIEGAGPPNLGPSEAPALMEEWISGVRKVTGKPERTLAGVEEAASRLRSYNPRLTKEYSLHLARFGTRETEPGKGVQWKFDPLHRTRSPQPFYLEQARAFWRRVTAPALLVRGALSPMTWDPSEDRENIPRGRVATIPHAGHMVHHDQPGPLSEAVLTFLKQHGI